MQILCYLHLNISTGNHKSISFVGLQQSLSSQYSICMRLTVPTIYYFIYIQFPCDIFYIFSFTACYKAYFSLFFNLYP